MKIIPAILSEKIKNYSQYFDEIQIDIAENTVSIKDVPNLNNIKIGFHLMVDKPRNVIDDLSSNVNNVIIHFESFGDLSMTASIIKEKGISCGLALNPETDVETQDFASQLMHFDFIQLMSVHPGKQGNEFIPDVLEKIPKIRLINAEIPIWIDGGINDKTIIKLKDTDIQKVIVGSYFNDGDIKVKLNFLESYDKTH